MLTNDNGFAQYQWEPIPPELDSRAVVSETLQPGFVAGRTAQPGLPTDADADYRCEAQNQDGEVRIVSGEFTTVDGRPTFTLDPIGQEIVTCTMWNSFAYEPDIALSKVNDPPVVRGDLVPPAVVRSSYVATNPGNTPLAGIQVLDNKCATVDPVETAGHNVGDLNADSLLDTGEAWQFTCDREIRASTRRAASGTTIVNTAIVTGSDPRGVEVQATATDDVQAFTPGINLVKLADGEKSVTVPAGDEVTYSFAVSNTGNTPLGLPTLTDDRCSPLTRGADVQGNDDDVLDLGETWSYTCSRSISSSTVNRASVEAPPLNPTTDAPFTGPNPPVTDTDTATVVTIDPQLSLTKIADQTLVFPGTTVTYTYQATNAGDVDLRNDTGEPGWIVDDKCAPVTGVPADDDNSGDLNDDDLLNPGETWTFTCSTDISTDTLNTGTITGQPVVDGSPVGTPIERTAQALVEVVVPDIALSKLALKAVVLDPDAAPVGPTEPDLAAYEYEVSNPGAVPLRNVAMVDDRCADPVYVSGDENSDDILDVDEVWTYTCETALQREQGSPPPLGNESGLVTNTAEVVGTPFLPGSPIVVRPPITDTDIAQVLVIEPSLSLTKSATPTVVRVGGEVTYAVEVTNTGDVGLRVIGPVDDKCAPLTYVSGDLNGNDLLDGANGREVETWVFTCARSIPKPVSPDTTDVNTAAVLGVDPLGNLYSDRDDAQVTVLDPAIALEKSVNLTLVPSGTDVTYDFTVTNAGRSPIAADDVLDDIDLSDLAVPDQPTCATPALVAKEGGNQDDRLDRDPAETWRYRCTAQVDEPTSNLAVVTGVGGTDAGLDIPVLDVASAFVQTFTPAISITKSASPTLLIGGGEVEYSYEVRNPGNVPLAQVAERLTDDTCSPVSYKSGDLDEDGVLDTPTSIFEDSADEVWLFGCTTRVDTSTKNTAVVTGTPTGPDGQPLCGTGDEVGITEPCDVRDEDTAFVTVIAPGTITIIKATTSGDDDFPFTLGGTDFTLRAGESRTFEDLDPGRYDARENAPDGWSTTDVECTDPTNDSEVAVAEGSASIELGPGETVVCTFTNTPQAGLPQTGAQNVGWLVAGGLILLVTGAGIMLVTRRRTRT